MRSRRHHGVWRAERLDRHDDGHDTYFEGGRRRVEIFDVPRRFSQKRVHDKVPTMDSTEFHAMFHEAATRGWDVNRW